MKKQLVGREIANEISIFHLLCIYNLLNPAINKLKHILTNCGEIEVVQLLSFAYIEKYF